MALEILCESPFIGNFESIVYSADSGKYEINLFDLKGSCLYKKEMEFTTGIHPVSIPAEYLKQGLMLLKVNKGNTSAIKKIIRLN
jgi:hypothetical protein